MSKETDKPDFLEGIPTGAKTPEGMIMLTTGAEFWNFEQNPVFQGTYTGEHFTEEPDPETGFPKLLGYDMQDTDGKDWIIGNSYAIQKSLLSVVKFEGKDMEARSIPKAEFYIQFLGKTENSKGQPVNRFKVGIIPPKPEPQK